MSAASASGDTSLPVRGSSGPSSLGASSSGASSEPSSSEPSSSEPSSSTLDGTTVTVNALEASLPLGSVAVHVTVRSPSASRVPGSRSHVTSTSPELSLADGGSKSTGALVSPSASSMRTWSTGAITGASSSTTVTSKASWPTLPASSLAEHSTVVVPIAKKDPEAGAQDCASTAAGPALGAVAVVAAKAGATLGISASSAVTS